MQEQAPAQPRRLSPLAAAFPFCIALVVGVACTVLIALVCGDKHRSKERALLYQCLYCRWYWR